MQAEISPSCTLSSCHPSAEKSEVSQSRDLILDPCIELASHCLDCFCEGIFFSFSCLQSKISNSNPFRGRSGKIKNKKKPAFFHEFTPLFLYNKKLNDLLATEIYYHENALKGNNSQTILTRISLVCYYILSFSHLTIAFRLNPDLE